MVVCSSFFCFCEIFIARDHIIRAAGKSAGNELCILLISRELDFLVYFHLNSKSIYHIVPCLQHLWSEGKFLPPQNFLVFLFDLLGYHPLPIGLFANPQNDDLWISVPPDCRDKHIRINDDSHPLFSRAIRLNFGGDFLFRDGFCLWQGLRLLK